MPSSWSFGVGVLEKEIGEILYLDCDLVVLGDLWDLWTTAGVMLMNLRRWRAQVGAAADPFYRGQGSSLRYWDQDAINAVLHDSILPLDRRWNVQAMTYKSRWRRYRASESGVREACRRPAILHYSMAEKPWRFRAIVKKKLLYFDYLAKTDWRSANPLDLAWYHMPEFYLDHLLARMGIDYTLVVRVLRRPRRMAVQGFGALSGPGRFRGVSSKGDVPPARQKAGDR